MLIACGRTNNKMPPADWRMPMCVYREKRKLIAHKPMKNQFAAITIVLRRREKVDESAHAEKTGTAVSTEYMRIIVTRMPVGCSPTLLKKSAMPNKANPTAPRMFIQRVFLYSVTCSSSASVLRSMSKAA